MIFSKTCRAAIKSVIFLAGKIDTDIRYSVKEIAEDIEGNNHTVGKLLQILAKQNIINSSKGPFGGFYLTKKQLNTPILKVVEAIDGKFDFDQCVLDSCKCSEDHPCVFHADFKRARNVFENVLVKKKISDLSYSEIINFQTK